MTFNGQTIGSAVITALVLVPGDNIVPTAVHYAPDPSNAAAESAGQLLLENFVQGVESSTIIEGTMGTTPLASLQLALSSIRLVANIPPIHQNLITQANLAFPLDIAKTHIAQSTFNLANPFTAGINLLSVTANATYQGIYLGQIMVSFVLYCSDTGIRNAPLTLLAYLSFPGGQPQSSHQRTRSFDHHFSLSTVSMMSLPKYLCKTANPFVQSLIRPDLAQSCVERRS